MEVLVNDWFVPPKLDCLDLFTQMLSVFNKVLHGDEVELCFFSETPCGHASIPGIPPISFTKSPESSPPSVIRTKKKDIVSEELHIIISRHFKESSFSCPVS